MYIKAKNLWEWRLWYKIIAALLVIAFLVFEYTNGIIKVNKVDQAAIVAGAKYTGWEIFSASGDVVGQDLFGFTLMFLGYFTIQSNILVLIFFIVAIAKHNFNHDNKNHKSIFLSRLGSELIAIYILVTGIIFNVMLLPVALIQTKEPINFWTVIFVPEVGHGIIPLMMVIYVLFISKVIYKHNGWFKFFAKDFMVAIIYPLVYLTCGLVRGSLIYNSYAKLQPFTADGVAINSAVDYVKHFNIKAYHYFFLDINTTLGKIFLPIAIITIILIILGLGAALNRTINLRSAKLADPEAYKANKQKLKEEKKAKKAADRANEKKIKAAKEKLDNTPKPSADQSA